jgi:hypothetical protein
LLVVKVLMVPTVVAVVVRQKPVTQTVMPLGVTV